jgi:hypothetical protein
MESRRFEVLPGSVDNHVATSAFRYALERHQPVRGGYLDDPDGGRCDAPARQKPEDGTHRHQLRISLNVNAGYTNSALDAPASAVRHQVATAWVNSGLAPGGAGPERPSLTGYATARGSVVTHRYCRCHPQKGEAKNST